LQDLHLVVSFVIKSTKEGILVILKGCDGQHKGSVEEGERVAEPLASFIVFYFDTEVGGLIGDLGGKRIEVVSRGTDVLIVYLFSYDYAYVDRRFGSSADRI
jgi:hypothetical protein